MPIGSLGDGPVYRRPLAPPADLATRQDAEPGVELLTRFPPGRDLSTELLDLLAAPNIADKSWVWRQYDHQLFLNTVVGPGGDASVLRLKETAASALALSVDGKGRFCALDPRMGAVFAVLEAARNVACSGARPLALVNCLNFGNPEHPEVMWQLSEAIDGMARRAGPSASRWSAATSASTTSPRDGHRPDAGGRRDRVDRSARVTAAGHRAARRRPDRHARPDPSRARRHPNGATHHGHSTGRPPRADLDAAKRLLHELVAGLVTDAMVDGLHDCSDGGVAVALAEMAITGGVGFRVTIGDALMCFSESASRVVLSVAPDRLNEVLGRAGSGRVPALILGDAGGADLHADGVRRSPLAARDTAWRDASMPSRMIQKGPTMGASVDVG